MKFSVLLAIFRRNFISYFSNPTGYVFICVFVLLSSLAAFWPNEFFNSNLANLNQLNKWLPYIMLVFIPAITMSIWAEERRLGTDELLLTIPAGDLEVVLGKYLAAVAIFTCSLAFSGLSNLLVLMWLGEPDKGLFLGNYFGYWTVGVTMLSIGMTASFLTANVTVGFILGVLFNAPLVFAGAADVITSNRVAMVVKQWSIEAMFNDFGRGVISLSSMCYFIAITAVMLYLSMLLIGRRHWWGGKSGHGLLGHYVARAVCLVVAAVSLTVCLSRYDVRGDVTVEQLTALSPKTRELLRKLDPKHGVVVIDAFVSPEVPESYVQTQIDLLNLLREIQSRGGSKLDVRIHETEVSGEWAKLAEEQFDITARRVERRSSGALGEDEIYMGLAVQSGPDKVVIPFIDRGIPLEYEVVRSIATVGRAQDDRKKLGLLRTDAQLEGGRGGNENILAELRKQYEVETIDPGKPIDKRYDVVLAVQPSSLSPEQMEHFIDMVRRGQPTAIFEDPLPIWSGGQLVGTAEPKRPQGGGMFPGMQGGPPQPKGDIQKLWNMLGVKFGANEIVWHKYNPYQQYGTFPAEFVFIGKGSGASEPFSADDPVTSGLQEMIFVFPGWIARGKETGPTYKPLVFTGRQSGTVAHSDVLMPFPFGGPQINPQREQRYKIPSPRKEFAMAAHIKGRLKEDLPMHPGHEDEKSHEAGKDDAKTNEAASTPPSPEINVILVADVDCLDTTLFNLRARGNDQDREAQTPFNFDNVTFILNVLDSLAGDERFLDVRKRRRMHRTLTKVEGEIKRATDSATEQRASYQKQFEDKQKEANEQFQKEVEKIRNMPGLSEIEKLQRIQMVQQTGQRKLEVEIARLTRERDTQIRKIERGMEQEIRRVRQGYKMGAVILPPIIPLLLGLVVFINRRTREREGVPEARLRTSGK
jgi:ABC-2 type transport system permease protein